MTAIPTKAQTWEGISPVLMARIVDSDGAEILQAGLSAINYYIYDLDDPDTQLSTSTLTIASVIFDTLQTGDPWTADGDGYNFLWKVPTASLPNASGATRYRVEIVFTCTGDGDLIVFVFDLERANLLSQSA